MSVPSDLEPRRVILQMQRFFKYLFLFELSNLFFQHSATARSAGVSRDDAKVLNYGRIYGAGVNFAKTLLQRFNPALTDAEARYDTLGFPWCSSNFVKLK